MNQTAIFNAYNLTTNPLIASVTLQGAAAGPPQQSKRIQVSYGNTYVFPTGRIIEQQFNQLELRPGLNSITLRDLAGTKASVPFLAEQVGIQVTPDKK